MRRIHAYFMSKSGTVSAPKELIELSLIERFHWLPTDIAKILYKDIQRLWATEYEKDHSKGLVAENELSKKRNKEAGSNQGRGSSRKFTREV